MAWYFLSFAKEKEQGGFLGGCVVQGADVKAAIENATLRGLNPGGEIAIFRCPKRGPEPIPTNRLLSRADLEHYGGAVRVGDVDDVERSWRRTRS